MERATRFALCSLIAVLLGFRIGLSVVAGGPLDAGRVGTFLIAVAGLGLVIAAVAAGFRGRDTRAAASWPMLRAGSDSSFTARWICVRTLFGGTRYPALHRPALPVSTGMRADFASSASVTGESSSVAPPEAVTRVRWVAQPAA